MQPGRPPDKCARCGKLLAGPGANPALDMTRWCEDCRPLIVAKQRKLLLILVVVASLVAAGFYFLR